MNLRYYAAAARAAGVPPMWVEDAAQDIAVHVWRSGDARAVVIHRRAIDAARHYGRHTRAGSSRETVPFEGTERAPDPLPALIDLIATRQSFRLLTPTQRRALARSLRRLPMRRSDFYAARAARIALHRMIRAA